MMEMVYRRTRLSVFILMMFASNGRTQPGNTLPYEAKLKRVGGWSYLAAEEDASCGPSTREWYSNFLKKIWTVEYDPASMSLNEGRRFHVSRHTTAHGLSVITGELAIDHGRDGAGNRDLAIIFVSVFLPSGGDLQVMFQRYYSSDGGIHCADMWFASVDVR